MVILRGFCKTNSVTLECIFIDIYFKLILILISEVRNLFSRGTSVTGTRWNNLHSQSYSHTSLGEIPSGSTDQTEKETRMSADDADAMPMPLIILVEDEDLIRQMLVEALEDAGFSTLAASEARKAVLLFEENGDEIRGLVTDVNLGDGIDGWELARRAREHAANLPVVYISGASGHEWTSRDVPDSLMITKPFAPAQVVVAISSLMVATDTTP